MNLRSSLVLALLLAPALAAPAFPDGPCPNCGGYHGGPPPPDQRRREAEATNARAQALMEQYRAAERASREAYAGRAQERIEEIQKQAAALRTVPEKVPNQDLTKIAEEATRLRLQELALKGSLAPAPQPTVPQPPGVRLRAPTETPPSPAMTALIGREMSRQRKALADAADRAKRVVTEKVDAAKERVTAPVRAVEQKIEDVKRELRELLGKE